MQFDVFEPLGTLWGHLKAHLGLVVEAHGIYGLHGVYGAQGLYYKRLLINCLTAGVAVASTSSQYSQRNSLKAITT